jgi:dynein heavy chain 1
MAEAVLTDLPKLTRSKYEQLITEFVHKRDTTRKMEKNGEEPSESFFWFSQMKYFQNPSEVNKSKALMVHLGNSRFNYGYEYLGITDKLVQTPLTDKCYFTLTQALWLRMGGAPFGPAGTGKTESVKMLGSTLGRFVLVFNCDETFNFKAMGRIFIGLCQVGAWGCFDEFNRLEERILSAVS